MQHFEDLTGIVFGKLTVLGLFGRDKHQKRLWECKCECGNIVTPHTSHLKSGHTCSCGCYRIDRIKETNTKHGLCDTPEYQAWISMKDRCYNVNDEAYPNYGGRGIFVTPRWLGVNGFTNFLEDMGKRPSNNHSLDRFPNNKTGIYELINCRWATTPEQNRNQRSNRNLEYNGETKILGDWAKILKISRGTLVYHLNKRKSMVNIFEYYNSRKQQPFSH